MARILSQVITDARGSVAGITFSKNTAGLYIRGKVKGTNPQTEAQSGVRETFAATSSAWRNLTEAQRNAWRTLAESVTWQDSLGQSFHPTGFQLFMQLNSNLEAIGEDRISNAPTLVGLPTLGFGPFGDSELFYLEGGGGGEMIINTTSDDTSGDWARQAQASNLTLPGINRIPDGRYRTIDVRDQDASPMGPDVINGWAGVFAPGTTPANSLDDQAGMKILARVRLVNKATGQATPWVKNSAIVFEIPD